MLQVLGQSETVQQVKKSSGAADLFTTMLQIGDEGLRQRR